MAVPNLPTTTLAALFAIATAIVRRTRRNRQSKRPNHRVSCAARQHPRASVGTANCSLRSCCRTSAVSPVKTTFEPVSEASAHCAVVSGDGSASGSQRARDSSSWASGSRNRDGIPVLRARIDDDASPASGNADDLLCQEREENLRVVGDDHDVAFADARAEKP